MTDLQDVVDLVSNDLPDDSIELRLSLPADADVAKPQSRDRVMEISRESGLTPSFVIIDGHLSRVIFLSPNDAPYEIAWKLANELQDEVIVYIHGVWPACPFHPHPLLPLVVEKATAWVCPLAGRAVALVGALGTS
jgi:hypothetical protein